MTSRQMYTKRPNAGPGVQVTLTVEPAVGSPGYWPHCIVGGPLSSSSAFCKLSFWRLTWKSAMFLAVSVMKNIINYNHKVLDWYDISDMIWQFITLVQWQFSCWSSVGEQWMQRLIRRNTNTLKQFRWEPCNVMHISQYIENICTNVVHDTLKSLCFVAKLIGRMWFVKCVKLIMIYNINFLIGNQFVYIDNGHFKLLLV